MEQTELIPTRAIEEASTTTLSTGSTLFVWSARSWLVAARERRCVKHALLIPYYRLECVGAIYHLDALMRCLTEGAARKIEVRCPHHPRLSSDEHLLLLLVRAAQQKIGPAERRLAGRVIRPGHIARLRDAAQDYAKQLSCAGLSVSSVPQLTLISGIAS